MTKKTTITFLTTAFFIGLVLSQTIFASQAGTQEDPLVSQSYVDQKFNQLLSQLQTLGSSHQQQPQTPALSQEKVVEEILAQLQPLLQAQKAPSIGYSPVSATKGQVVLGGEGCEIILRSGTAIGYITAQNGMVDVTSATDIGNGSTITQNHLIIVPRNDGRGVKVTSDIAWFIVKGEYTIQ